MHYLYFNKKIFLLFANQLLKGSLYWSDDLITDMTKIPSSQILLWHLNK